MAPVYYVSGNHEWTVEGRREVWAQMEEAGAILLDHRWVTLERQGASITLAGIQDPNGPAGFWRTYDQCCCPAMQNVAS